jgi:phenylacetate-CoA ligase
MQSGTLAGFPRFLPPDQLLVRDLLGQLRAFESAPPAIQRATQAVQLGSLLRHAATWSPFWRARIAAAGIDARAPFGMEMLARLPILLRTDVQANGATMRAHVPGTAPGDVETSSTSGSTGLAVRVEKFRPLYKPLYEAAYLLDHQWHQRDSRQLLGVYVRTVRDEDGTRWGPPISWFEAAGPAFLRSTATTTAEAFLDIMRERQPAYVATYPSALRALAAVALERGGAMPPVRQFITSTEPVTAATRALARRVFGARVTDRYSCEECGWLAHQCPIHDHYHVLSAQVVLEVVDDDGQACAPGQPGRVLVTALHSYAMPLIRYDVGDLAVLGEGCDCGITLPVLSCIEGREREFFVLPDGTRRSAAFNLALAEPDADILEQQMRQYSCGTIEVLVRAARPIDDACRVRIARFVGGLLDNAFPVQVRQEVSISWTGQRKHLALHRVQRPYREDGLAATFI